MKTLTLDRVLTDAESLSPDDQTILEELLRGRRIESWRRDVSVQARKDIRAFHAGKLKSQSAESAIARLRSLK
jgi:hypothetical protein